MTLMELARTVYQVAYLRGDFLLRSGQRSKEYFDKYRFEAQPEVLQSIAKHLATKIPADTMILAGLEMGGIPIATALSLETKIPACFVRKEAKTYGTAQLAEGSDVRGKKVLIVEDVITSGGQVLLSAAELKKAGALIEHVICVIDREQGGREKLLAQDLKMTALFTMTELKTAGAQP